MHRAGFSTAAGSIRDDYLLVLRPNQRWWTLDLSALGEHSDLLRMLVRRDLLTRYRQTILGPLWFILQPVTMALIFSAVFARAANVATEGVPPMLFYLASLVGWNFFSQSVGAIGGTFVSNAELFSKVYFPRLVVPCAIAISNLATMGLQFALFLGFYAYHVGFTSYAGIVPGWQLLALPFLVVQLGALALGVGLLIASFTGRYRDLLHALQFLLLAWMFLTPVFLPLSKFAGKLEVIVYLNPVAPVVEAIRQILVGVGSVEPAMLVASALETLLVLLLGVVLFQRVARTVADTV